MNSAKDKNKTSNGRVNIVDSPDISNLFAMYDKIPANQCVSFREPTLGQWDETMLSKAYFSQNNIQVLQNGIRDGVYRMSNGQYEIGQQDCDTLKIIMRSIFLQYSANKPTNIYEQVNELNKMVLDYCIPQVFGEAQGYRQYLKDASTMYTPIPPPVLSTQSDKELMLKPWF